MPHALRASTPVVGVMALNGLAVSLHQVCAILREVVLSTARVSHTNSFVPVLLKSYLRSATSACSMWCAIYKFKRNLRVQSILLRVTQLIRGLRFTSCATHSHSSSGAFAVAKATWLSSSANGAAITRARTGWVKASAFPHQFCWRYVAQRVCDE